MMSAVFFQGVDGRIYHKVDATLATGSTPEEASAPKDEKAYLVAASDEDWKTSPKCMMGTHLAAISSADASETFLCFQDRDGYLWLR